MVMVSLPWEIKYSGSMGVLPLPWGAFIINVGIARPDV